MEYYITLNDTFEMRKKTFQGFRRKIYMLIKNKRFEIKMHNNVSNDGYPLIISPFFHPELSDIIESLDECFENYGTLFISTRWGLWAINFEDLSLEETRTKIAEFKTMKPFSGEYAEYTDLCPKYKKILRDSEPFNFFPWEINKIRIKLII